MTLEELPLIQSQNKYEMESTFESVKETFFMEKTIIFRDFTPGHPKETLEIIIGNNDRCLL